MSYLVRSGYEQMKLLSDRKPIEEVLKDPKLPADQRHKLELALKVRDFAESDLKLHLTNNYKTFVDLKRPYVTYIVTVAKKWQLEPELYWYPIVGSLPYKGFFTKKEAEEEAAKFTEGKKAGEYDVMVRGVSAYSTLGWFNDPLLSSMLNAPDYDLVNMIIHESTHATLYIKSQADFNEQLATYIGNLGTEIYYKKTEGAKSPSLTQIAKDNGDEKLFSEFISQEVKDLAEWYKAQPPLAEKATEDEKKSRDELREKRLAEIQEHFTTKLKPKLSSKDSYGYFTKMKLNNAVLLHFKTYVFDLSQFDELYQAFNGDFVEFIRYCKTLEKNPNPHAEIKKHLAKQKLSP